MTRMRRNGGRMRMTEQEWWQNMRMRRNGGRTGMAEQEWWQNME
jgi:hypothetical protein